MIWICLSIYILGALFTGIFTYTVIIRIYIQENSRVKFSYWLEHTDYVEKLILISLFWCIVIPITIILLPIWYLIKRINKHYNIE